ncbi:MAG: histidine phosphatase family protein [Lachnospiraceae bacterium]|nr:histidine phosphatase family protein [Lachnospiraceae bacterium]
MGHMIYFARHGQTVWNVENKICGASESELTELGFQQAEELAEKIKSSGIHIDEILYSPLIRAKDTALTISRATGIPARPEMRIKEQNFGYWEGTPRDGQDFAEDKKNFIKSYGTGESMFRLAQRVYNLLDELKADDSGKTYLLVAHNGIARIVESYFRDMTNEEFARFGIRNCDLREYHFS